MKKQLIKKVNEEKQQYESILLKANEDVLRLQEKLQRLDDGTDDERLKNVLKEIKQEKINMDGLLFLHRSLERSLIDLENDKSMTLEQKVKFRETLNKNLKDNEANLKLAYKEYYKLLRKKLEINCDNIGKRKDLKRRLKSTSKVAASLIEEEFVDKLIKIFRSNNFSNLYDSKEDFLNYSFGQIFLIKYAITQVCNYYDTYDYTPNMLRQIKILANYTFKPSGKNLSYQDFINSLENGNLQLCDFNYPILTYEGALKLYKHISFTFCLPKQIGYVLKKSLK